MRIAYIITRADSIGGAQVHVRDLAEALLARGHDVTVLAGGDGEFFHQLAARRIPYRSLPRLSTAIKPGRDLPALVEIVCALRDLRPEIVAVHTAKAGFLGRLASRLLNIPAVFTPHGWTITDRISSGHGRIFRCAEVLAGSISSRIINVCEFETRLAITHRIAPQSKLTTIYNGIPDISPRLFARVTRQPPRIVMVARFAEPKGHLLLLKALSALKNVAWSLELIGDGPLENKIKQEAARLDIADRISITGFCPNVAERLAEAQIFALVSRFEAFPYTILEAMRARLSIVASDVGGISEAVLAGRTGLLSPAADVDLLRKHLALLIANPELRKQFGDAGRRRYLRHFTFEKMVDQTLELYAGVLSQHAAVESGRFVRRTA